MIAERKNTWRALSIIVAFMMVFTSVMIFSTTTVDAAKVKPKSITLKATAKQVDIKGKITVSVKSVKPAKASKAVIWKSSDKKIATVNKKGVVIGKKPGKVTITAISKANKNVKKAIKITIKDLKPAKVALNKKKAALMSGGDTLKLKAELQPAGVYNKGVTWKSSDASVAKVSKKGVVTPLKVGTTVITVKTKEGNKAAKCTVTVEPNILMPYLLVGFYDKAKFNNIEVSEDAEVLVWDAASDSYKAGVNDEATILGNYVQMTDSTGDKKADLLEVVKFADSKAKWDASMEWLDGVGETTEPAVSDETGRAMYVGAEYRIPLGERLLTGFGLGDWSGSTDHSNLGKATYWPDTNYDIYNTTSSDTLTILPQYKTELQTTGWACVMSSALSVLEYYGERGDLNELDLSALREEGKEMAEGTYLDELITTFNKLEELGLTRDWTIKSSFDEENWAKDPETGEYLKDENGNQLYDFSGTLQDCYTEEMDGDGIWIEEQLKAGYPIMVAWNSYGAHGQVIIGYDNMGTDSVSDDVLIMMDPYDTTDHNANGYNIQSYERFIWGCAGFDVDGLESPSYLIAYPAEGSGSTWTNPVAIDAENGGIAMNPANSIIDNDANKLNYDATFLAKISADLTSLYGEYATADNELVYFDEAVGVGGPLAFDAGNYPAEIDHSPYYNFFDFYNMKDGEGPNGTLKILENYKTIQQSTEWACGCTSSVMVMEYFGKNPDKETDVSLSAIRQINEGAAVGEVGGTYLYGMKEIFDAQNAKSDSKTPEWTYFTMQSLDDPSGEESYIGDYCLQAGTDPDWPGLIPYLIDNDIPMMIGWDEWGGHWQTIIGYDDMGTPYNTQDDVLVLADSYDSTDHSMDGYVLESFERLVYGWDVQFETWSDYGTGSAWNDFIVAFPTKGNEDVIKTLGLQPGANN